MFGAGRYAPATPTGQHLLAHELAHVLQQRGGPQALQGKAVAVLDDSAAEREADAAADRVVSGGVPPSLGRSPEGALQRAPDSEPSTNSEAEEPDAEKGTFFAFPDAVVTASTFRARIDVARCELTVEKRIKFLFENSPGPYEPWGAGEPERFVKDFERVVMEEWNHKFALVPDGPCKAPCPAVTVAVKITPTIILPGQVDSHMDITDDAVHVSKPKLKQGEADHTARRKKEGWYQFTDRDVLPTTKEGVTGIPAAHEFGHMLGLRHVSWKECEKLGLDPNDPRICYGKDDEQRNNVMGWGLELWEKDGAPFAYALGHVKGFSQCQWKAKLMNAPTASKGKNTRLGLGLGLLGLLGLGLGGYLLAAELGAAAGWKVGGAIIGGVLGVGAGFLGGREL